MSQGGGELEGLARGEAFAVWARVALADFPGIAEGREARERVTGRDALALMRAAHAAGWVQGRALGRAEGGGQG